MIVKKRAGCDSHVGERGLKLFGGQRRRVAIARVFLDGTPILMVDKATPAVDSDVKAAIQETFRKFMENKTPIAIAYRASTIAALDDLFMPVWKRQPGGFFSSKYALAETRPAQ